VCVDVVVVVVVGGEGTGADLLKVRAISRVKPIYGQKYAA
jgi:hypothetical protein